MPPSRSQSTTRSFKNSQLLATPPRYKLTFEDDEVFVRTRPPPPPQEELDDVFTVADGLEFGWKFRANYAGLERAEYSSAPDPGMKPEDPRPPALRLGDFEYFRTLGEGESCKVVLARTIRNEHALDRPGSLIAMKIVTKKYLRDYDTSIHIWAKDTERSILTELPWNPFVTGLIGTFVDAKNVYLGLEFMGHGDLRSLIRQYAPLPVAAIQFYFCGIAAGIAFLHEHEIVHRDIKPENVLIGPGGYPVLVDFGAARRIEEDFVKGAEKPKLDDWETVGSILYTPPEMVDLGNAERRGCIFFGPSVDWWASGVVLYEMATRRWPFFGSTTRACTRRILHCAYTYPRGARVGRTLKALIKALLHPQPERRLGTFGVQHIMDHPWFSNIDWAKIVSREYVNPMESVMREPQLENSWHKAPLLKQKTIPGLKVKKPELYLRHDKRFRPNASQTMDPKLRLD